MYSKYGHICVIPDMMLSPRSNIITLGTSEITVWFGGKFYGKFGLKPKTECHPPYDDVSSG